ncbi:MAG: O-antigen ligase family protein, partial [Terracidiphilus sp.]
SLIREGHLTTRQIANAGALMNLISITRIVLFLSMGIWLGGTGGLENPVSQVANASYPMIWFTLMQLLDLEAPLTKPVAVLGMAFIVLTEKRGAFVSLLLGATAYGIAYAYINRRNRGIQRVLKVATGIVFIICLAALLRSGEIAARWEGLNEPGDEGSGRGVFWVIVFLHWLGADWYTKFVGFGPHSTYDLLGSQWFAEIPAHNDWLQILHEFGVLGLMAFAAMGWAIVRLVPRLVRNDPKIAPVFCAALACAFTSSLLDIFSYSTETAWFGILMATPLTACLMADVPERAMTGKRRRRRKRRAPSVSTEDGLLASSSNRVNLPQT